MENSRPNPVFDDEKTFIGEIRTYEEACNLPVNRVWCICKSPNKIEKYHKIGCKIYFIDNGEGNDMCYVSLVSYPNGDMVLWDMNDEKIEEHHIEDYISTLSDGARQFISQLKIRNENAKRQKSNESLRINNKNKIYKLNMTHIKKIDEMFSISGETVSKNIENATMKEMEKRIRREPNENHDEFVMRMKKLYQKAVDELDYDMPMERVEQVMKNNNIQLAMYDVDGNEIVHLYTADGNRYSEGIFVHFDEDQVVSVLPPYRDKKFTF